MHVLSVQTERVKRQWRVRVTLDDGTERLIWPETHLRFDFHPHDLVSAETWDELILADDRLGSRAKSLRLLAVRPRSSDELRRKLKAEGFLARAIELCLAELADEGLLDDSDFARRFARARLAKKPMGRLALDVELRRKGIDEKIRRQVVSELVPDEVELVLAEKAARRKVKSYRETDPRVIRRKLSAYLSQRGFSGESIGQVLQGYDTSE